MDNIAKDIEESKKEESVNMRMTDGKIVCSFSMRQPAKNKQAEMGCYDYVNYPKVFDDFDSFVEYAKEFFKSNISE